MIEKIRHIVIEDFDLSEVKPIDNKIEEIRKIKGNVESLTKALEKLKSYGAKSVISVKKEEGLVRIPSKEFIKISENGDPYIKNTNTGKIGVMKMDGINVHATFNEEQAQELIAKRHPFKFWYSDVVATNLGEFYRSLEKVSEESLEHHLKSGDFSNWLFSIGENQISKEFKKIEKRNNIKGDARRILKRKLLAHVEKEIKKRLNV